MDCTIYSTLYQDLLLDLGTYHISNSEAIELLSNSIGAKSKLSKADIEQLVEYQKCEDNDVDAINENVDMKLKVTYAGSIREWSANSIASYFKLPKVGANEIIDAFQNIIARKQKFNLKWIRKYKIEIATSTP